MTVRTDQTMTRQPVAGKQTKLKKGALARIRKIARVKENQKALNKTLKSIKENLEASNAGNLFTKSFRNELIDTWNNTVNMSKKTGVTVKTKPRPDPRPAMLEEALEK